MPNKTIYVKEADKELWEKAEKLAGGSVSSLLTEALKRYVEEEERKEQVGMENIEVELMDQVVQAPYRAQFVGRWLLYPQPGETTTREPGYDAGTYFGVALTQRGNIAVYISNEDIALASHLLTCNSFKEAESKGVPGDILAMAASQVGTEYVYKLDI